MKRRVAGAPARPVRPWTGVRRRRVAAVACASAALASVLGPPRALATNYVWTNLNGSNVFNESQNWSPLAPPGPLTTNDAALFDGTQPGSDTFTVTFNAPVLNDRVQLSLPGVVTFNLSGQTYTVDGGLGFRSLIVGQGSGLLLTNGSVVASDGTVGDGGTVQGGLQVVAGGSLAFSRSLGIGSSGNGAAQVRDGGALSTAGLFLGTGAGSRGTLDVVGANSAVHDGSSLQVGNGGTGQVQVFTGGLIDAREVIIGCQAGGSGTLLVSGTNARLTGTRVTLGLFSRGDATVSAGARVSHTESLQVGSSAPASLLVTGTGSSWSAGTLGLTSVDVGSGAFAGTVTVDQGAAFSAAGNFNIAGGPGGAGEVALAASGSTISAANMYVGGSLFGLGGNGRLTVAGGTLTVGSAGAGQLQVYRTGTVELRGGTINTQAFNLTGGRFDWSGGTLNVARNANFFAGSTGTGLAIGPGRALIVGDQAFIDSGVALTLDGGVFTTRNLLGPGTLVLKSGSLTLGSPLTIGAGQPLGSALRVGPGLSVNVNNTARVDAGSVLALAGGTFSSSSSVTNFGEVQLADDFSNLGGTSFNNSGLVSGSGRVSAGLTNASAGTVRASQGQRLSFRGTGNGNAGSIDLVGGTVEFINALTNAPTGEVHGRGTLVTGGLTNQGAVLLSGGITDVFGNVTNAAGGRVVVSGNAGATFWDDVTNNGAQFKVADGSSATFFGTFSGQGISGTGKVYFEGTVSPGNSPGLLATEGDVALGDDSVTRIELAGHKAGVEYDRLDVGGELALAGTLQVVLLDGFEPSPGDTFDVFDARSVRGRFAAVSLPMLGAGLAWDTRGLSADGSLAVVPEPRAGVPLAGCAALVLARRRRERV